MAQRRCSTIGISYLGEHKVIKGVEKDINDNYLSQFAFTGDVLQSRIRIAPDLTLTPILEKFELSLLPRAGIDPDARCPRGLGYNNALFMATELVLLPGPTHDHSLHKLIKSRSVERLQVRF